MKKSSPLFLVVYALLIFFSGCTQNGGTIGDIFGRWNLVEIEGENVTVPEKNGDIFFAFQSDIVMLQRDNGYHEFRFTYGSFQIDDNILRMDFPEENAAPFSETLLPRSCALQIRKLTRKEMILEYHKSSEENLIYYLKKW